MKLLQLNTTVNTGSTGRIAEDIGRVMRARGHESYIGYGRDTHHSKSNLVKIGSQRDVYQHGLKTVLLDRHGFGSHGATEDLIRRIDEIQPDVIGLHNLHGYYLHIGELFKYLQTIKIPILWTLFDCWAFTGHCTYYDDISCEKWKTECHHCPKTHKYPKSLLLDQSRRNYHDKKKLFHLPDNMELIVHSKWLKSQVEQSFLKDLPIHHIYNGTDLEVFRPLPLEKSTEKVILGVASTWDARKGLQDFVRLREILPAEYTIRLIGLSKKQISSLPEGIEGISRTESLEELVRYYNEALVFVNPTWQDNFPTTNIEALACGTPVITYDTGGSPEAVSESTGFVVKKGEVQGIKTAIEQIAESGKESLQQKCRQRAEQHFDKEDRYRDYLKLYEQMINR